MKMLVGILALAVIVAAAPATADHNGPARAEPGLQLNADIGERTFHLGARLLLAERTWGAWLWGESRPGGPHLEGRLEAGDRPFDFSVDVGEIRDFVQRWLPRR
jgi:hypothetical protein